MSKFSIKNNKTYIFASKKFPSLNSIYGINKEVKKIVDENLEKQTEYLKNNYICLNDKNFKSFLELSRGANINPNKYYGEMFNRVSSLKAYAKEIGFTCGIFITLTPPSYLKPLKQIQLSKKRIKLVDNPNFSGEANYVDLAREYQSKKWTKFLTQRIFKDIKAKYNERLIYMRTYEPMIDGTPHVHIVAFIPPEFKERFVKLAKKYFGATRFDIKTEFNDEIGGIVAYILKYILKSFSNSKTNQLDDVGYWYAYHKIRRFTTSRTLIPLKFYRLINSKKEFRDLLEVTKLYKSNILQVSSLYINPLKYHYVDYFDVKSKDYKVAEITVYVDDWYQPYFEVIYERCENITAYEVSRSKSPPLKARKIREIKPDKKQRVKIKIENDYYIYFDDILIKINPVPAYMKDYELYKYYKSLNASTCDYLHFGIVENECKKRGLLEGKPISLNEFSSFDKF